LNYSERISIGGEKFQLSRQGLEKTTERIAALMSPGDIVPLFTELRTNPADAASRVQAWERENVERLGFAETMVGAVR
jgi:hypothetical protein